VLVTDPHDTSRWIEALGHLIDLRRTGAKAHAAILTRRYLGKDRFL
jgi:hypothetical protein